MSSNRREMLALLMAYQALCRKLNNCKLKIQTDNTTTLSYINRQGGQIQDLSVRTTLETMPQEESELDWRAYSRILQCKSRPPQPSFRDESQIVVQSNQELQLATEEGSVQSHPTSVRSNTDGSVRISPEHISFSTINGHRSMLNQLLLLKNQTDIVNDPFITRIMTGIHKLRPSSAKYQEIWDANQVFKHLSTIKVIPKYTALLKKTLVLCPVINAKEQRKGVLSILELTSLDDTNSQVCPVRHLSTYLRASKGRRKPHSGDSVFIQNEGKPLDVKEINIIVLSTLSSSGIDISKFKSHSTRSAMASLLLSNNVPFHVVKKMGRWKSNDTVDTFYDKRIIGEKSGGFLNTCQEAITELVLNNADVFNHSKRLNSNKELITDEEDEWLYTRRGNIIIKKDQDVEPTKKQIYYSTDDHKRHVEEMVLKFIDLGIIKRSESNYSSPIMLLKKRDSWRVVHDYRQLNKVTVRDDHPFTPVDSLLNQCKDSKLFSKFDMIMGYFQVLINPEHAKYTALVTHFGKFEYTRMPQGLVNSPSTFARLMVEIYGKIKSLLQYFDDLLVHSKLDYMVHFIEIIRMLLYCRKYLLFISKEKSEMLKTEVGFLGFHIHKEGISPRAAKVRAIIFKIRPKKPITFPKYQKENKKTLSDESLKEFNILKKKFEGEKIVTIPIEQDNTIPIDIEKVKASTDMPIHSDNNNLNNGSFHFYCDVSDKALSGVLYQIQGDKFKVIWFHSRKLTDTQKKILPLGYHYRKENK
ncbi:hypothetical protein ACTFIR_003937 [Dictyostelium discoideum]